MIQTYAFIIGACIGSFLNVIIYRTPRELSIVKPRSFCPGCNKPIPLRRNIPIVSYFVLQGKCPDCSSKISWRYPFVEVLTAVIFLLIVTLQKEPLHWIFNFYLMSALIVTTLVDLEHWIIPDAVTLPGIIVGFISSFIVPQFHWIDSLLGILFGGGSLLLVGYLYLWLAKKEGIGGGDIKYLAMVGAFMGIQDTLLVLIMSSLIGSLVGLIIVLTRGGSGKTAIPFGPFLAAATLTVFVFGKPIWEWYLSLGHVL